MEEKIFTEYFHAYYRRLCLHALHFTENSEEAEEVVQEIFVHLWEKKERLETIQSIKSYLYRAVRNNCLMRIRDAKPTTPLDTLSTEQTYPEEDQEERAEMEARIWQMIDDLPERRREIFLMAKRDGMSYKEIALQTGLSVKTVENHVFRAMLSLRTKNKQIYLFFFA